MSLTVQDIACVTLVSCLLQAKTRLGAIIIIMCICTITVLLISISLHCMYFIGLMLDTKCESQILNCRALFIS